MTMRSSEELIYMVYQHPILYDQSLREFKDTKKKDDVWADIGRNVGLCGEAVKKKWKNLRDSYAKYVKSTRCTTSHEQQRFERYKHWPWVSQMEVFNPYFKFTTRQESDNVEYSDEIEDVDLDPLSSTITPTQVHIPTPPRRSEPEHTIEWRRATKTDHVTEWREDIKRRRQDTENTRTSSVESMDATELVFLGFAKTVNTFSPVRQAKIKLKIAQLLLEEELQHQEEIPLNTRIKSSPQGSCSSVSFHDDSSLTNIS